MRERELVAGTEKVHGELVASAERERGERWEGPARPRFAFFARATGDEAASLGWVWIVSGTAQYING